MQQFIVNTMDSLINTLEDLYQKCNHVLWFRGQEDAGWGLQPSIQRSEHNLDLETYLANDFYIKNKKVLDVCPAKNNYAAWLSMMQHYGLPTRLLDWSQSPLIAAFFATKTYKQTAQTPASIWVLDPSKLNEQNGFGAYLYPSDAYTAQEMLRPAFVKEEKDEFRDKILACHCVENDLRMYSQQSCFTIHNSQRKLTDICDNDMLFKLIIPGECKEYFFECLKIFGITESFVFPDTEHIAHYLKELTDAD